MPGINLPPIDIMASKIYLPIDITDYENSTPLIYFIGQKGVPFQRYVCVYQDIGRGPPGFESFRPGAIFPYPTLVIIMDSIDYTS
jgi:hypothetical protein